MVDRNILIVLHNNLGNLLLRVLFKLHIWQSDQKHLMEVLYIVIISQEL